LRSKRYLLVSAVARVESRSCAVFRDLIERVFGRWGGVADRRFDAPVEWRRMLRRNPALALLLDNPAAARLLFPTAGVQRQAQGRRSAGRVNPVDDDLI
jgi:hypothetical protein